MPRNAAGTYSLPNSPVVTGTTIDSADENYTRDDLASEMTNSLDRGGRGAMTAALKIVDGTAASPGIQFSSDANNGFFRNGADDWSASAGSTEVANFTTTGTKVFGFKLNTLSPAQITANQNDYNPTSLSSASYLRLDTDAARDLTGLQGGVAGRCIRIHYVGSTSITLKNESASSTAAYRFALPADLVLGPDMSVDLTYDATTSRWRMQTGAVSAALQPVVNASTLAAARTTLGAAQKVVTTKGDLHVGGAAGAESRKAVGTNGQVLTVDSAQTDGMAWAYKRYAPCGRLTLTSATAVTADDVTGASTVYFTPYNGDVIELYDGAGWIPKQFTELSQATSDTTKSPAAVANDSNYDIFVWNDSGTLRATRGPAWSSDTARGTGAGTTELELLEGRYVNKVAITNGPAAQRGVYVGTIRSDGSAQINDSKAKRHVWNNFNRRDRSLLGYFTADRGTNSSSYTELNSEIRVNFLIGLNDEPVKLAMTGSVRGDNTGGAYTHVNVAIDNTTPLEGEGGFSSTSTISYYVPCAVTPVPTFAGIGSHYATVIMFVGGAGATVTMPGSGSTGQRTALVGIVGG